MSVIVYSYWELVAIGSLEVANVFCIVGWCQTRWVVDVDWIVAEAPLHLGVIDVESVRFNALTSLTSLFGSFYSEIYRLWVVNEFSVVNESDCQNSV